MSDITADIQYNTAWQKYTELSGQLGELQFKWDNIWAYDMKIVLSGIIITFILIAAVMFLSYVFQDDCEGEFEKSKVRKKFRAGLIIVIVLCCLVFAMLIIGNHFEVLNQIANVESQMDALEKVWNFNVDNP